MPRPTKGERTAGSGRKAGTRNKATADREREIAAAGLTPLDYMLGVLRDPETPSERKDWAAKSAAPYCHPTLAQITQQTDMTLRKVASAEPLTPAQWEETHGVTARH